MRAVIYEIGGLGLIVIGLAAFYGCVEFLAAKDFISGVIALAIGFVAMRSGVELSKLSVLIRREED